MERKVLGYSMLGAGLIGFSLCNFAHILLDDSDSDIEKIQTYNYQIADELSTQFESIEDLRLTVDGQDFEFDSAGRSCSGEYEVTEEVATIAGDITCSQTIQTES